MKPPGGMRPRDPAEPHRVATPLELLFDLCFVVAVAQASAHLHHGLSAARWGETILGYTLVFFAIWWAWMNFTWFASAYDVDDAPYRLAVLVQIAGVLVLAAGVPRAFEQRDFHVATAGYAIMRIGLVALWLRAAGGDRAGRRTAIRYAIGLTLVELGWLALLALPADRWLAGWLVLAPAELLVPVWAEWHRPISWHPHHIAERFGLLTLIVLGESVLSASMAIQAAVDAATVTPALLSVIGGGILVLFAMWWLYFDQPAHHVLVSSRAAFVWGYGHLVVFASTAAVGAGLAVAADYATGRAHLSGGAALAVVAVPLALYAASVWALVIRPGRRTRLPGRS
jgi:low temperature requirement protein LtrA